MCSEMSCDRRSVIPPPAFSSTVSSSSAVTPCNRAGRMDITLGFTVSNTCGGWLRARHRNEPSWQNFQRFTTIHRHPARSVAKLKDPGAKDSRDMAGPLDCARDDREWRAALRHVSKIGTRRGESLHFLDRNRHAQKRCAFPTWMDHSFS